MLISILDPNDRFHTDSTRLTALRILNTACEVAGLQIREYPSLMALIQDHGCKYLFQLASSDNQAVLQMTLRVITTIFETMRDRLMLQLELFLTFTIDRLMPTGVVKPISITSTPTKGFLSSPRPGSPAPSTPTTFGSAFDEKDGETNTPVRPPMAPVKKETRELMLEALVNIARHPSFAVDLYSNYDCNVDCEDVFERLIDFLTKVFHDFLSCVTAAMLIAISHLGHLCEHEPPDSRTCYSTFATFVSRSFA